MPFPQLPHIFLYQFFPILGIIPLILKVFIIMSLIGLIWIVFHRNPKKLEIICYFLLEISLLLFADVASYVCVYVFLAMSVFTAALYLIIPIDYRLKEFIFSACVYALPVMCQLIYLVITIWLIGCGVKKAQANEDIK